MCTRADGEECLSRCVLCKHCTRNIFLQSPKASAAWRKMALHHDSAVVHWCRSKSWKRPWTSTVQMPCESRCYQPPFPTQMSWCAGTTSDTRRLNLHHIYPLDCRCLISCFYTSRHTLQLLLPAGLLQDMRCPYARRQQLIHRGAHLSEHSGCWAAGVPGADGRGCCRSAGYARC